MRRAAILLAIVLALTLPTPAHANQGGVHIAEILPAPGTGAREFIELSNDGPDANITGWTIQDGAGTTYTFGQTTLPAGARIVVWGGGQADARGPAWSRASVWNNGGDTAVLRDASGATVDGFAYGSAAWPDGRSDPVPTAPATNRSLSLVNGAWIDTAPTPGMASTTGGGSASATVQNVPPELTLGAPGEVQAGALVTFSVGVHDGNGDSDIVAWNLSADGVLLANGSSGGDHAVQLTAPSDRAQWILTLRAQDMAGNRSHLEHIIDLRVAGLVIIMPPQGLAFPAFPPGAAEVTTNASFVLRNDSPDVITPRIDVSDLAGPATIPVAGRLELGNNTWTTYDGPLTSLPALQPGESTHVYLRLRDIPSPLPAGSYGTSFTVIA